MSHVFVSYARSDSAFMSRLINDLESGGIEMWVDREGLNPGTPDWDDAIRDAITRAFAIIYLASPDARRSPYVQGELSVALDQRRLIIPVWALGEVWTDCAPLNVIKTQWIDCRSHSYGTGVARLLTALRETRNNLVVGRSHVEQKQNSALEGNQSSSRAILRIRLGARIDDITAENALDQSLNELMQQALRQRRVRFVQKSVTSVGELATTVASDDWDIIDFVGTGEADEVLLRVEEDAPEMRPLDARQLGAYLRLVMRLSVRLLMFESFLRPSSPAFSEIVACAPFVITVDDTNGSNHPSPFVQDFFVSYLQLGVVEQAFERASIAAGASAATLVKRARYNSDGKLLLEAKLDEHSDPLIIDLSSVQDSLGSLGLPQEKLLYLLATKIRAHQAAFDRPRDRAMLSIGSLLYGEFTWGKAGAGMKCTKLMRFRDDVNQEHWSDWCQVLVTYNDLCGEQYRLLPGRADASMRVIVAQAVHRFGRAFRRIGTIIESLVARGIREAGMYYSLAQSYQDLAANKLEEDDLPATITYLESALTSFHDVVKACMPPTVDNP